MAKQALILHAWYEKPESNWYPWLRTELEKRDYTVHLPDLPTLQNDMPELKSPLSFITTHLRLMKKQRSSGIASAAFWPCDWQKIFHIKK